MLFRSKKWLSAGQNKLLLGRSRPLLVDPACHFGFHVGMVFPAGQDKHCPPWNPNGSDTLKSLDRQHYAGAMKDHFEHLLRIAVLYDGKSV